MCQSCLDQSIRVQFGLIGRGWSQRLLMHRRGCLLSPGRTGDFDKVLVLRNFRVKEWKGLPSFVTVFDSVTGDDNHSYHDDREEDQPKYVAAFPAFWFWGWAVVVGVGFYFSLSFSHFLIGMEEMWYVMCGIKSGE